MEYILYNFFIIIFSFLILFLKNFRIIPVIFPLTSVLYSFFIKSFDIVLEKSWGIHLIFDKNSQIFFVLNSIVFLMAALKLSKNESIPRYFYFVFSITYATINFIYISYDLFNIYVLLELISLETTLLIIWKRESKHLWAGTKYLILGTVGMNFYLLGVGIIYHANRSFDISLIKNINSIPAILILSGLLLKSGVFLYGMWLPDVHSNATNEISAVLSGTIVKASVFTLVRLLRTPVFESYIPFISKIGIITAIVGAVFAMNSNKYKRILAFSTMSQMGYILVNPFTAYLYSFSHGISKAYLFLLGSDIKIKDKEKMIVPFGKWIVFVISIFSIMGLPFTLGYYTKKIVLNNLDKASLNFMKLASISTVIVFIKLMKMIKFEKSWKFDIVDLITISLILSLGIYKFEFSFQVFNSLLYFFIGLILYIISYRIFIPIPRALESIENNLLLFILGIVGAILVLT